MFLGPFDPPFYELGNFVKILDPPPPLLGIFPKFYHVRVLKASLIHKMILINMILFKLEMQLFKPEIMKLFGHYHFSLAGGGSIIF